MREADGDPAYPPPANTRYLCTIPSRDGCTINYIIFYESFQVYCFRNLGRYLSIGGEMGGAKGCKNLCLVTVSFIRT